MANAASVNQFCRVARNVLLKLLAQLANQPSTTSRPVPANFAHHSMSTATTAPPKANAHNA